jgi:hypothetical protein
MPNAKDLIERARMFEERAERGLRPHFPPALQRNGGPLSLAISRASGSNAARTRIVALTFAAVATPMTQRSPAGASGIGGCPCCRFRQRGAAADAEKAGGRYADGFYLRLPARFPVPSRSTPSLHRHS